ncbi:Uncharacterised protein [Streptococcus pneumoniae]|nr:Uncharacterised protein [Streptococcus pneumoniae]CMW54394.1 Uncharacterised protein [Streptococcus pneumoniae]CNA19365.1 Uncharacterised protein [Streptococcus pneumoniae]
MKFTQVAFVILTVKVIDTVSGITRLLGFKNQDASTDSMHGATWYIEEISSLDRDFGKQGIPVLVLDLLAEFFF